jgi:hypothetical protein
MGGDQTIYMQIRDSPDAVVCLYHGHVLGLQCRIHEAHEQLNTFLQVQGM